MKRKNIFDLHYSEDANGNDVLCTANGSLFTGIVEETQASGFVTTEYEVRDGLKDGVEKEFYSDGSVEHIVNYRYGILHGDVVYYYSTGIPKEKSVFEYEILTEQYVWNEDGELLRQKKISPDDIKFKRLLRMRENYPW